MKKVISLISLFSLLFFASPVWATPQWSDHNIHDPGRSSLSVNLFIPEVVGENSSVISLGPAIDPQSGKVVEGFAIIHPKTGFHHRPDHGGGKPGNGNGDAGSSSCYSFLSKGAKWKNVEPWVVNTANAERMDSDFIFNNLTADITKWEDAAGGVDILGNGSTTTDTLVADTQYPDGKNEVYFADISSSGAIGVTIVWGVFGGRPSNRELVEWDQVYDDVDFDWSATGEAGKMDFENITTHELGHTVGMDHPDDSCTEETMYRFATEEETKKRDLNTGDITGVAELYN